MSYHILHRDRSSGCRLLTEIQHSSQQYSKTIRKHFGLSEYHVADPTILICEQKKFKTLIAT